MAYTSAEIYAYIAGGETISQFESNKLDIFLPIPSAMESNTTSFKIQSSFLYAWSKNPYNVSTPTRQTIIKSYFNFDDFALLSLVNVKFNLDYSVLSFTLNDTANILKYIATEDNIIPNLNSPDWGDKPIQFEVLPFGTSQVSATGINASLIGNNISLSWDCIDNNVIYQLERKANNESEFTTLSGTGLPFDINYYDDLTSDASSFTYEYKLTHKSLGIIPDVTFHFSTSNIREMFIFGKIKNDYIITPISTSFVKLTGL